MFPITHIKKVSVVASVLAIASSLSSCNLFESMPEEVFYFRYLLVEADPRINGTVYSVPNARNASCGLQPMRLEDIARAVQEIGGSTGYQQLYDCAGIYTIGDTAEALRANIETPFDLDFKRDDGVQVVVTRTTSNGVSQEPTSIRLVVNSGAVIDQPTNNGYAIIDFGRGGPVFRCEAGNSPWHVNISNDAFDTFFEFELDTKNADYGGGKFSCLARNTTDETDKSVLIIMGGRFAMKTI